jgi:rhodanese-related sulfurtransferase
MALYFESVAMKTFQDFISACLEHVDEVFPWDLAEQLEQGQAPLLLDIREPYEFDALHIKGSLNVPRGVLESACEYNYEETVPELVEARERDIIVICRSGNRSVLAARTMQLMGYCHVKSLKTGIRGWNDYEQPLQNSRAEVVEIDDADEILAPRLRPEQLQAQKHAPQFSAAA